MLSARIIPENGGETQFTSTRLAWDRLPGAQKEELRDLIVVLSYANSRDQIDLQLMTPAERAELPPVRWRMIWHNPANGRDALYVASHAAAVEGMDNDKGKALLARLIDDATQEPVHMAIAGGPATRSCGTTAPRCIAVGLGRGRRRG